MPIELLMPSNHLILCHPLLLLPSIFPNTRIFLNETALCIRWLKYWSFSFNISPSSEYSGLISFKIDWFDLLAVQETLKSSPTPQFKSINSSALSYFLVQLSHPCMTTGKAVRWSNGFWQFDLWFISPYIWFIVKWPEGMKKGGNLIQGSREGIKMLSILIFKLIG